MTKRDTRLYVEDIRDFIRKIEEYIKDLTLDEFSKNSMVIDAVIRNLSVTGEAAKNIPDEIKEKHINVPWSEIMGMRNKVVHEYFGVDEEILWKTIKEDLPVFKVSILDL